MTENEKRYIEGLLHVKAKPTLWHNLTFRPALWLPFFLILVLGVLMTLWVDRSWGMFIVGMSFGAILRIVGQARRAMALWKITEEITDWSKVDALFKKCSRAREGVEG